MTYQPRWLAFSRATGVWPGDGVNHEFIIWIGQQWREWEREVCHSGHKRPEDHEAFDRWLNDRTTTDEVV